MAIELENSFTVPVPPDQAWDVLLDVERMAPCMPGATVDEVDGDVVNGRIKVKVGPVSLTYRGTAKFTERDPGARLVVVEASGKETRGAGTASANVRASLAPDASGSGTQVTMHTTMNVTGRAGAAVINVASISGWAPQLAMSGQYGAAKAALIFDTERWALECVPHGVRVNTVSPGSILVDGNGWDRYRIAHPDYFDDYVRHGFPMGRLGTAEEVADVIVFLASSRAHWINGRHIAVDGLEQPHAPLDRRPF